METDKQTDFYILPRDESERLRLDTQHGIVLKHVYDGKHVFDETVKIGENDWVLDSGAGTCSWALGLSAQVPGSVQIYATDLSTKNFPSPESAPANLHMHVASSTQFPFEWSNKFTLVHQRLLIIGIRAKEWPIALSEIFRVLKPGGAVLLVEGRPPPPTGPAMEKVSNLIITLLEQTGHSYDLLFQFDKLLTDAGFKDVHVHMRGVPFGKELGDASIEYSRIMRAGLTNLGPALEKAGLIPSRAEYLALLDEMEREWREHGSEFDCRLVTARKPA